MADERCVGCKWHTPQKFGGEGIVCNQSTMVSHNRCPEWVINWFLNYEKPRGHWNMSQLLESLKL